jgi:hypothetical protein
MAKLLFSANEGSSPFVYIPPTTTDKGKSKKKTGCEIM